MRVCGIASNSEAAVLVVLDVDGDGSVSLVDTKETPKIKLGDHREASALRAFQRALDSFLRDHAVDRVVLRRCSYKGQQTSGAVSLKIEAVILLLERDISLVAPQSISASFKKADVAFPTAIHKYQSDAFHAAVYAARQK